MVFDARCFVKQSTLFVIVCCYCSLPISWSILQENEAAATCSSCLPNRIHHQLQFPKYCCNYSSLRCNTSSPCQIGFTIICSPIKYCCHLIFLLYHLLAKLYPPANSQIPKLLRKKRIPKILSHNQP